MEETCASTCEEFLIPTGVDMELSAVGSGLKRKYVLSLSPPGNILLKIVRS